LLENVLYHWYMSLELPPARGLAQPIRGFSRVGQLGLRFPWRCCPGWSDRGTRRSNYQPLRSPSLGLCRGTPINMYQGYAIQPSNIQRHFSLQHGNYSLGSFFCFCYSQTLGVYRPLPTLPRLHHLPSKLRLFSGELCLPLMFCATTSNGR
jgi:hypothetical protein